jgi:CRP-like cAMP-binding protein
MAHEAVLATTGGALSQVYFPHSGVISLVMNLATGKMIEVAMIGRDSVFGASAFYSEISLNDAIVQLPGTASTLDLPHFLLAAEQSATLRAALLLHGQVLLMQAQQSAACNAFHSVDARLSRWLLRMSDLAGTDRLALTQDFLAEMIGVQRNSVSLVAHTLQKAGLIHYSRGNIQIIDREGLTEVSCECYEMFKTQSARLLNSGSAGDQTGKREAATRLLPRSGTIV